MSSFNKLEITCENIKQELKNISAQFGILTDELDFDILETITYISDETTSFVELNPLMREKLKERSYLLNPNLTIKQKYRLLIKKAHKDEQFHPIIKLSADKHLSRCIATISKESVISPSDSLASDIRREVNKKKIRHGLLINIFDDSLRKGCESFAQVVKNLRGMKDNFEMIVCETIPPKLPILPEVKEIYKKEALGSHDRVDHRKRGIYNYVQSGSAVVEFIKGKRGEAGRNCKGEYVAVKEIERLENPPFSIDESIRSVDLGGSIVYYAQKNGFVDMGGGVLSIKESVEVDSVNLRDTGSIEASKDSNTTLNVSSVSFDDDSVAPNMVIESKIVNVQGSVGAGATVSGEEVSIKGQTHQSAIIRGDKVYVKRNKGQIFAKDAIVDVLEGGVVVAEKISVRNALGGDIKGAVVLVALCGSNIKIFATDSITVERIGGEGSIFTIDAQSYSDTMGDIERIKVEIDMSEKEKVRLEKKRATLMGFIENNKESVLQVKGYLKDSLQRGENPNQLLVRKLEEYRKVVDEAKNLQEKIFEIAESMKISKVMLDNIQNKIFNSKIELKSGNLKDSLVAFKMLTPRLSVSRAPKEGEHIFRLVKIGDEYIIKSE